MRILFTSIIIISISLILEACSASTGTRYERDDKPKKKNDEKPPEKIVEDFDITPYRTKLEVKEKANNEDDITDAWYGYNKNTGDSLLSSNNKIVGTVDGFRVLVVTTDDMNEANTVRDKIYELTNRKEVYISFEPPFYKVKAGDFTDVTEADNLKFKLNQFGYTEARVVQETVNIYEQ